ncbi:MAG: dihydrolipoamide acetyltransferase family protein [Myxococcaceae bacterium]
MKQTVTMPALSDTMNVGRLTAWLKKPGDAVKKGEAIAQVETDKAVMDVEAFYDGYLAGPLAPVASDLPLGAPIAYIVDTRAEAESPAAQVAAPALETRAEAAVGHSAKAAAVEAASPGSVRASPYARAVARKMGLDLSKVAVGKAAPIDAAELVKEVAHASPTGLEEGPPHQVARMSTLREAVAREMIAGMGTPTFRLTALLPLEPLHRVAKEKELSLTLLLARACALVIGAQPLFNAAYTPQGLAQRGQVDIGIAMDIPDGLVTPVLRDAARRPLAELVKEWATLRDRVKSRRLTPQDYRGATFYLSDLGVFPVVRSFDSIIPVGASAILSVAAAQKEGALFTLSCDHRVVFGADGARFLTTLSEWLSNPGKLVGD